MTSTHQSSSTWKSGVACLTSPPTTTSTALEAPTPCSQARIPAELWLR
ncbi:hypothetical protein LINPERPRIM_LOCUS27854 [Linum perenne]